MMLMKGFILRKISLASIKEECKSIYLVTVIQGWIFKACFRKYTWILSYPRHHCCTLFLVLGSPNLFWYKGPGGIVSKTVSSPGSRSGPQKQTWVAELNVSPCVLIYRKCHRKHWTNKNQCVCHAEWRCVVDAAFVKLFVLCCHGRFDVIVVPWPPGLQNPSDWGETEGATCPLNKCGGVIDGTPFERPCQCVLLCVSL